MFRVFTGFLLLILLPLFVTFCNSDGESTSETVLESEPDPVHNSMNSLNWAGTYEGITPCADCPGIETRLILRNDESYELTTRYIGKSDSLFKATGSFSWNESGSKIRLDAGNQSRLSEYLVRENRVVQLNMNGEQVTGDLAESYKLEKISE